MSVNDGQEGAVDPNLRMTDPRSKSRYPSPYFDVGQQYIPPTMKELFKWVYFYATNNSFLGPALRKIARYPITDLIFEDGNKDLVQRWSGIFNNTLQIKTFEMEVNMDLITYGNAIVTFHYPFSRFLECTTCHNKIPWKAAEKKVESLRIRMMCPTCSNQFMDVNLIDMPYRSIENLRPIRINPEFIDIKYNDATGRHTYLYNIPDKLRRQIMSGDLDILEDTPKIYIEAIKQRKKIKLSPQNIFHLKSPSLAGKDMGWGLPILANTLKDLYYFYTMRKGQEAIINEHLTPFDIIFPQAAGKYDPFVHSDLSNWKREIEKQLAAKRRDPAYKAVLPFPIGFERIGGDGKAMMLTPELDFLSKTIIGACGIPQEFVFGGSMQWSASSISLRTLENDFLHHRSQLLQMIIWMNERIRIYLGIPACKSVRFSDFKMADDMQKLQMMIQAAQLKKISWTSVLQEWGRDPEVERQKIEEESEFEAKMMQREMVRQAEGQSKAQKVQMRYQRELQEDQLNEAQAQAEAATPDPTGGAADAREETINAWAQKLVGQEEAAQNAALQRLASKDPDFASRLAKALAQLKAQQSVAQQNVQAQPPQQGQQPGQQQGQPVSQQAALQANSVNMTPLPQQRPPRRQGGI